MPKNILTVLGCSSSLAITLVATASAHANQMPPAEREYVFTAPTANLEVFADNSPSLDCGCSTSNDMSTDFTDEEGEQAISLYGCDCAGCRYMVRNQEGEEALNL